MAVKPAPDQPNAPGDFSCETDDNLEAIILYPSLGAPMVLDEGQKKCSVFIATGADALAKFIVDPKDGKAKNAYLFVDRHLRLTAMSERKPVDTDPKKDRLFNDGKGCEKAQEHVRVWHLGGFSPGMLLTDRHGPYFPPVTVNNVHLPGTRKGRLFATIANQLNVVHRWLSHAWEIEIDLDALPVKIGADAFLTWSWMVESTDKKHKQYQAPQPNNFFIDRSYRCHQPQDRDIDDFLRKQCGPQAHLRHYDYERLFESDLPPFPSTEPPPPSRGGHRRRLQAWHPVIRAGLPLKFGHLSDVHVNVRHYALAKSEARIVEDAKAEKLSEPIGKKVCNSLFAVRQLIQTMAREDNTALVVTGDLIDFNRNVHPEAVPSGAGQIGAQWKVFNVLANIDDYRRYRRGRDDMLVYSMIREAYLKHKMPVFMTTGNHEAYQFVYGVNPRVALGSWAFKLGALEKGAGAARKQHPERGEMNIERWLAEHRRKLEEASGWLRGKGNEGIPADHNLTIFEATLAYGPTYGQVYASENFDPDRFDWFYALFTPLENVVLALGAEPDAFLPKTSRHVLALLGWGQEERYTALWNLKPINVGKDQRGSSFLPYAPESFSKGQLRLLAAARYFAQAAPGASFVAASHFTVFNFGSDAAFRAPPKPARVTVKRREARATEAPPRGAPEEGGFTPHDTPQTDYPSLLTATWFEKSAQFNRYNTGGCESGVKFYFENFANTKLGREAGRVDLHFSGHSHRAGVYALSRPYRGTAYARGFDPAFDSGPLLGTNFIVSSCAGLVGWQNFQEELSGHTLRPPSGTWVDPIPKTIKQIRTMRSRAEGFNEKPRLCIALDYLWIMAQTQDWKKAPLHLFPAPEWGRTYDRNPYFGRPRAAFSGEFRAAFSEQMQRLDCLDLDGMRVWIFKEGKEGMKTQKGAWHCLKPVFGKDEGWSDLHYRYRERKFRFDEAGQKLIAECLSEVRQELRDAPKKGGEEDKAEAGAARTGSQRGSEGEADILPVARVLQAFCEVPLRDPGTDWSREMVIGDPWVFPLEIGQKPGIGSIIDPDHVEDYLNRPYGEKSEVPDWWFLAKFYAGKGYIPASEAIRFSTKAK